MGSAVGKGREQRRVLFGSHAATYDRGRPGYPQRVVDLLRDRCGLGPATRVLEIGAGSGQATRALLDAGASVLAVELSQDLAALLLEKHPTRRLEVHVGAFEQEELPAGSFDLAVSATAFHWVPTEAGLRRCAAALGDGGSLALWWNVYGDPTRPDPFHDALQPVLAEIEPTLIHIPSAANLASSRNPYALDAANRVSEIEAAGFGPVHCERIPWTGRHRAHELRALFATFSPWLALPPARRQVVLDAVEHLARDRFEGVVERPYITAMYLADKV